MVVALQNIWYSAANCSTCKKKKMKYYFSLILKVVAYAISSNNCAAVMKHGVNENLEHDGKKNEASLKEMPKKKYALRIDMENYIKFGSMTIVKIAIQLAESTYSPKQLNRQKQIQMKAKILKQCVLKL